MGYPYTSTLSEYTPTFPGGVFSPLEVKNRDDNGEAISGESVAVPGSPDPAGKYRVNLAQVPLEQSGVSITIGGTPLDRIPWGETPASGQVAISTSTGALEFHSSAAGATASATYTGRGTALMAHLFHVIQKELAATQTSVAAIDLSPYAVGPGSSTDNALARFDGTTGKLLQDSAATLSDAGALSAVSLTASTGNVTATAGSLVGLKALLGQGTTEAPALTPNGVATTGLYWPDVDQMAVSLAGSEVWRWEVGTFVSATGGTIGGALTVLGDATVNGDLSVTGGVTVDGSETRTAAASTIAWNSGSSTLQFGAGNNMYIKLSSLIGRFTTSTFSPYSSDGWDLGSATYKWAETHTTDLYVYDDAVITGDVSALDLTASGSVTAGDDKWIAIDASAFQPDSAASGYQYAAVTGEWSTAHDAKTIVVALPVRPGDVLDAVRIKYAGFDPGDGIIYTIQRRDDSATGTSWTTISGPTTETGSSGSVLVVSTTGLAHTVLAGYAYRLRIESQVAVTGSGLYGVGIQTTSRKL